MTDMIEVPVEKLKPGPGWHHIAGAVYENRDGLRIHLLGLARLPDGRVLDANGSEFFRAERFIQINGGNRKRGLMAWAAHSGATASVPRDLVDK